ncbi:unnamed protein product [Arctia plantaginis]|uniref:Uncharacterized protein n=1 Tax=Arctia plantaginis TaxID=874455 RepID=A0A8S1A6E8_ARCPL|nr:unnamed protein product [Arctia plantaginis]CAB3241432.1 unnamed protein product [Arctia plantaginis]
MADKKGIKSKLPSPDPVEPRINDVSEPEGTKASKEDNTKTEPSHKTQKKRSIYFDNVAYDEGGEEHMLKTDESKSVKRCREKDTTKIKK